MQVQTVQHLSTIKTNPKAARVKVKGATDSRRGWISKTPLGSLPASFRSHAVVVNLGLSTLNDPIIL
jgi:hypothetical protein